MRTPLPGTVVNVVERYLRLLDSDPAVSGLVRAVYLVGSVALGEFREAQSDIDFVALVEVPPTAEQIQGLRGVHASLGRAVKRPYFDGIYLTRPDLAKTPDQAAAGPAVQQHGFMTGSRVGLDPITWHSLARHGITVRGTDAGQLDISDDGQVLAKWIVNNTSSYWQPWLRRHTPLLSVSGVQALGSWAPAWGVLGISRLAYTLDTAEITSKEGAGEYALSVADSRWQPIVTEALRIRRGVRGPSLYGRIKRRDETLGFVDMMIKKIQHGSPA